MESADLELLGTLGVALIVGLFCTGIRVVSGRWDWAVATVALHGGLWVYSHEMCGKEAPPAIATMHESFCCQNGACEISGYGNTERVIYVILAFAAILVNVIPKYWKGQEAVRHMVHVRKAKIANPLMLHIVGGILTIVASGVLSLTGAGRVGMAVAYASDLLHQLSIHRLLRNHDGIWALRVGNMSLSLMKWVVMLNVQDTQKQLDFFFFLSCGFAFTRVFNTLVYIGMYLSPARMYLVTEYWYSIGLFGAQFVIYLRFWRVYMPVYWLSAVACASLFYHQLWRKWLHLRPACILACACLMAMSSVLSTVPSIILTLAFVFANFLVPHFQRTPIPGVHNLVKKKTLKKYGLNKPMKALAAKRRKLYPECDVPLPGKKKALKQQGSTVSKATLYAAEVPTGSPAVVVPSRKLKTLRRRAARVCKTPRGGSKQRLRDLRRLADIANRLAGGCNKTPFIPQGSNRDLVLQGLKRGRTTPRLGASEGDADEDAKLCPWLKSSPSDLNPASLHGRPPVLGDVQSRSLNDLFNLDEQSVCTESTYQSTAEFEAYVPHRVPPRLNKSAFESLKSLNNMQMLREGSCRVSEVPLMPSEGSMLSRVSFESVASIAAR